MDELYTECAIACTKGSMEDDNLNILTHEDGKTIVVVNSPKRYSKYCNYLNIPNTHGVHFGLWLYAKKCVKAYNLDELFLSKKEVIITGYSRGAAAAIIIRYMMRFYSTRVRMLLYDCPKYFTRKFKRNFNMVQNISCYSFDKYHSTEERQKKHKKRIFCTGMYVDIVNKTFLPTSIKMNLK
jgi:hypothetical protein